MDTIWPPLFLEDRNLVEEAYVKSRLKVDANESPLLCFLRDYDEDTAEETEIAAFCGNVHRSMLEPSCPNQRSTAWIDDRSWSYYNHTSSKKPLAAMREAGSNSIGSKTADRDTTKVSVVTDETTPVNRNSCPSNPKTLQVLPCRRYTNPLSAQKLFGILKQPRFSHTNTADADRRLLYISNLDPYYVHILAETVTVDQAAALKTALYSHIAMEASMEVNISSRGYLTFEMNFHMPFYVLRSAKDKENAPFACRAEPHRTGKDLSFLANGKSSTFDWMNSKLEPAHVSITICGVADRRWTAYAFVDGDEDMSEDEFDNQFLLPDMIADRRIDSNCPIWNPREYFLLVVLIRLEQVVKKWTSIIRKFEQAVPAHMVDAHSNGSFMYNLKQMEHSLTTYNKAIEVLRSLHDTLCDNNEAWGRFSIAGGHIGFFNDFENVSEESKARMTRSLRDIRSNFGRLSGLQRKLETLERRYLSKVESLEKRLEIESSKVVRLSGSISELMFDWVSPVVIVSAIFAIPQPFGNFPRTIKSFLAAMAIVFFVLKALAFVKEKQLLHFNFHWRLPHKILALKDKDVLYRLSPLRIRNHRHRTILRTDTETTLLERGNMELDNLASQDGPSSLPERERADTRSQVDNIGDTMITSPSPCRLRNFQE